MDAGAQPAHAHLPRWAAEGAGLQWSVVANMALRQLLDHLVAPAPHYQLGPTQRVDAAPPDDMNCYTGGGLHFRPNSPAALGNWGGVLCGPLLNQGLALLERSGWLESHGDETSFWGSWMAQPSFTRSEAWGLVAAHLAPAPLPLGLTRRACQPQQDPR